MTLMRCQFYLLSAMVIGGGVLFAGFTFANVAPFYTAQNILIPLAILATLVLLSRFTAKSLLRVIDNGKTISNEDKDSITSTLQKRLYSTTKSISALGASLTRLIEDQQQKASATTTTASKAIESAAAISGAIEEMNRSIREIERQSEESTRIAQSAGEKALGADQSVIRLSDFSEQIVSVVGIIRAVAQRTNLLALNASIEAARAGEQGKGFAVVAQEVKALANQTAEATSQIESQIENVRGASIEARDQMQSIQKIVQQMNVITVAIKSALQQQSSATQEVASGAQKTASAVNDVTVGISHLLVTSEEIRIAAESVNKVAKELEKVG